MPDQRSITIHLPAIPASWNQLNPKQLEDINRLLIARRQSMSRMDESAADLEFKLLVFLYLTGLRVCGKKKEQDGEIVYLMRRNGWMYRRDRIPMKVWQIHQWIDKMLKWLDNPLLLTKDPYGEIKIGRKHFSLPGNVLINATFYQYLCAQNLLTAYFGVVKRLSSISSKIKNIKEWYGLSKQMYDLQCRFVSCLMNKRYTRRSATIDGVEVKTGTEYIYLFRKEQIDGNKKLFKNRAQKMFPVILQYFQSVQEYYSKAYSELYRPGNAVKKQNSNPMLIEEAMLNGVMKYQGFNSYDEIYNAPVNKILGVMNNICKDAKSIEEANARMKRK